MRTKLLALWLLTVGGSSAPAAEFTPLPQVPPEQAGMSSRRLEAIDTIVQEGLRRENMPGAVVLVARQGQVVHFKAYGHRQLVPEKQPMQPDTVFDLASVTKPVATATSIMKLIEQGKIALNDPVATYLPEFAANGKEQITVLHLLTHQSGLIADNPLSDYQQGRETAWQRLDALRPLESLGSKFIYSDVGFILLGRLVEQVSGQSVHEFSRQQIFEPLGLRETGYLPAEPLRLRAAVTQQRDGHWMRGEVHDPRAFELGGVAGHAGLFSTAAELAVYAQMLLNGGTYQGVTVLKPETVQQMTQSVAVAGQLRGLGWDKQSVYSSNKGDLLSASAYGHGGFTGTGLWIDPEQQLIVVFLSNRVHPDGKGLVNPLIGRICTVAAAAIRERE